VESFRTSGGHRIRFNRQNRHSALSHTECREPQRLRFIPMRAVLSDVRYLVKPVSLIPALTDLGRVVCRLRDDKLNNKIKRSIILQLMPIFVLAFAATLHAETSRDDILRRIVGQKIIVGFFGRSVEDPDFKRVMKNLEEGTVGGVLFLGRNVSNSTDLRRMVDQVRHCKCIYAPLVAIDEEGGVIERLGHAQGFEPTPSAAEIGEKDSAIARTAYARLAEKLAYIGFNMNLAPVVDLKIDGNNPVIGRLGRSFSGSPTVVVSRAAVFIEEHHKRGIATCLKHFPGHGSSISDSHDGIADVTKTWSAVELLPYKELIKRRYSDSIMVGHLANLSSWGPVATQYGSHAVDRMLRQQLKYDGVVISDDLSMGAIRSGDKPFSEAIVASVRADVDIVIVTRIKDDDELFDTGDYVNSAILAKVDVGTISRAEIARSNGRIKSLKMKIERGFGSGAK
jgi:beta-N-acetylhexosaminidase